MVKNIVHIRCELEPYPLGKSKVFPYGEISVEVLRPSECVPAHITKIASWSSELRQLQTLLWIIDIPRRIATRQRPAQEIGKERQVIVRIRNSSLRSGYRVWERSVIVEGSSDPKSTRERVQNPIVEFVWWVPHVVGGEDMACIRVRIAVVVGVKI